MKTPKTNPSATPASVANEWPALIAEFRSGGDEETFTGRDKTTGAATVWKFRKWHFETSSRPITVTAGRDATGADSLGIETPLVKGKKYLLAITEWAETKGAVSARGYVLTEVKDSTKV